MKTQLKENKPNQYPYLGKFKATEFIVLFVSPSCGTVIHTIDRNYNVGYYSNEWGEDQFNPLPIGSEVTITQ